MPGYEHGHDHGLAAACGHLASQAIKERIGKFVGPAKFIFNPGVTVVLGHLSDVNDCLQGFYLAIEELWLALRSLPVFQQASSCLCNTQIPALPPLGDSGTNMIDELVFFEAVLSPFGFE